MDPFDKEEYIFYKYGAEAVKVYKNKIIYKTYYTSTFVELKKSDILSIRLELFSIKGGYYKRIAIKAKKYLLRQRIILNGIENTEQLFNVLNVWYKNEIDKNLSLDYSRYVSFEKQEKQMYSFIVISWILLIGCFVLLLFYAFTVSLLRSQSCGKKYTSYDKNKTVNYLEDNTLLCPKYFEFINTTENDQIYTYRNECVIGKKMIFCMKKIFREKKHYILILKKIKFLLKICFFI